MRKPSTNSFQPSIPESSPTSSGTVESIVVVVGTVKYTAPEGCKDEASDVWSLGMVVCELAMLRYPYPDGPESLTVIINEDEAPRLSDPHPSKEQLREFIAQTLIKDSSLRKKTRQLMAHKFLWTPCSDQMDFARWLRDYPASRLTEQMVQDRDQRLPGCPEVQAQGRFG